MTFEQKHWKIHREISSDKRKITSRDINYKIAEMRIHITRSLSEVYQYTDIFCICSMSLNTGISEINFCLECKIADTA